MYIIGWDAAVQPENNGLILCRYVSSELTVVERWHYTQAMSLEDTILKWFANTPEPILMGIDIPLGWPQHFAEQLTHHVAGDSLGTDHISFFKRECDLHIIKTYKKIPLDVSADRVARAAYFTLQRLQQLKHASTRAINLLWTDAEPFDIGFIEVYPASTLIANGFNIRGYKKQVAAREQMLSSLITQYNIKNVDTDIMTAIDHDFDALVCCMAAVDFLEKRTIKYTELTERIKKEGWVWTKEYQKTMPSISTPPL